MASLDRYTHHEAAHRETHSDDGSDPAEVKCAQWLHRRPSLTGGGAVGGIAGRQSDEHFLSLSEDFSLLLCSVDGDLLASWRGNGMASAMTVLPPANTLPENSLGPVAGESRSADRRRGWTIVGDPSPLSHRCVRNEGGGADYSHGNGSGCDTAYPVGHRVLVVRSEVYVELYEIRPKPLDGGGSSGVGTGIADRWSGTAYVFVALTHIECATPIVSLSPSFAYVSSDCLSLLVIFFEGDLSALRIQVSSRQKWL